MIFSRRVRFKRRNPVRVLCFGLRSVLCLWVLQSVKSRIFSITKSQMDKTFRVLLKSWLIPPMCHLTDTKNGFYWNYWLWLSSGLNNPLVAIRALTDSNPQCQATSMSPREDHCPYYYPLSNWGYQSILYFTFQLRWHAVKWQARTAPTWQRAASPLSRPTHAITKSASATPMSAG